MVFHWSLSDSKSSQVSWTSLSILADLNNAVVLIVSICPLITSSSSQFTNPLGIIIIIIQHHNYYHNHIIHIIDILLSALKWSLSSLSSSVFLI